MELACLVDFNMELACAINLLRCTGASFKHCGWSDQNDLFLTQICLKWTKPQKSTTGINCIISSRISSGRSLLLNSTVFFCLTATMKLLSVNLPSKHTCCYFIVAAYTGTIWQRDVGCWSAVPLTAHQGPESEYHIQSQLMPAWTRPLLLLSSITVSDWRQACRNHLSSCVSLCVHEIYKRVRCMVLSQDLSLVFVFNLKCTWIEKRKKKMKVWILVWLLVCVDVIAIMSMLISPLLWMFPFIVVLLKREIL